MDETTFKIYVSFVDAIECSFHAKACLISENVYQILEDEEFDYEDNCTLFEFGPQDIVETREAKFEDETVGQLAYKLVKAGDPRNLQKRLQMQILLKKPEPEVIFDGIKPNEIELLIKIANESHFTYPAIQDWLEKHKAKIQSITARQVGADY